MRERLIELRKTLKLSQTEFGAKIGLSRDGIASYERGLAKPTGTAITAIINVYNVNREWLETGEGEMFSESRSVTLDKIAKRYNGSETFRAMLDVYARLTSDQQNAFETYVSMLTQAIASGESPESVKPPETSLNARLGSRSEIPEADRDQRRAE